VLPLVAVLAVAPTLDAAPAADLVVVWAPGGKIGPVEAAAKKHGAAVIDRSPLPPGQVPTADILKRGIAAYDATRFDDALTALDQARDLADRTGAAGLSTVQLSDLFVYRGLTRAQLTDVTAAWEEFVTAVVVDPARELDPARFAPNVAELLARAKESALHGRPSAPLEVVAPLDCAVTVDGSAQTAKVDRIVGPHWVRVTCADHAPWGARIDLTNLGGRIEPTPVGYVPPSEADLLVQARVAGVRSLVIAELHGEVATARLISLDGRERDRRTVTIKGDLEPLGVAVGELLTPAPTQHWYQKRWAWAAGAAAIAAIVLVPITALIASDSGPTSATVRPDFKGMPPL
jgi:hypothetical protein